MGAHEHQEYGRICAAALAQDQVEPGGGASEQHELGIHARRADPGRRPGQAGTGETTSPPAVPGLAAAPLLARATSSGLNTKRRCSCWSGRSASSSSSSAAARPSWYLGWRTEVSGTAASAANSMSS